MDEDMMDGFNPVDFTARAEVYANTIYGAFGDDGEAVMLFMAGVRYAGRHGYTERSKELKVTPHMIEEFRRACGDNAAGSLSTHGIRQGLRAALNQQAGGTSAEPSEGIPGIVYYCRGCGHTTPDEKCAEPSWHKHFFVGRIKADKPTYCETGEHAPKPPLAEPSEGRKESEPSSNYRAERTEQLNIGTTETNAEIVDDLGLGGTISRSQLEAAAKAWTAKAREVDGKENGLLDALQAAFRAIGFTVEDEA